MAPLHESQLDPSELNQALPVSLIQPREIDETLLRSFNTVPSSYGYRQIGPEPGTVVGIVLGSVGGALLLAWLAYLIRGGNKGSDRGEVSSVYVSVEKKPRGSSRSRSRSRHRSRSRSDAHRSRRHSSQRGHHSRSRSHGTTVYEDDRVTTRTVERTVHAGGVPAATTTYEYHTADPVVVEEEVYPPRSSHRRVSRSPQQRHRSSSRRSSSRRGRSDDYYDVEIRPQY